MNNRKKLNNLIIVLLFLAVITGFFLIYVWRSDFQQTILYILSWLICGTSFIFIGGFLLLLPSSKQDKFLMNSFLIHFMSYKEKEGNIVSFRGRGIGLMILIFGVVVVIVIISNYF